MVKTRPPQCQGQSNAALVPCIQHHGEGPACAKTREKDLTASASPPIFALFQDYPGYLGSFEIPYEFRMRFSTSSKKRSLGCLQGPHRICRLLGHY